MTRIAELVKVDEMMTVATVPLCLVPLWLVSLIRASGWREGWGYSPHIVPTYRTTDNQQRGKAKYYARGR